MKNCPMKMRVEYKKKRAGEENFVEERHEFTGVGRSQKINELANKLKSCLQ